MFGRACHFEKCARGAGQCFRFRGSDAKVSLDAINVGWLSDELAKPLEGHGLGQSASQVGAKSLVFGEAAHAAAKGQQRRADAFFVKQGGNGFPRA
jgi:hypothetical protein